MPNGIGSREEPGLVGLRRELALWLEEFGLRQQLSHVGETASAWAFYCGPSWCSTDDRLLATVDLALWLFAIDDHEEADTGVYLARCIQQLGGIASDPDVPIERARARLLARFAQRGATMDRYLSSRVRYVEAIEQRNRYRDGSLAPPSFEEYLRLRQTTIYVEQWLDGWGVLGGLDLAAQFEHQPALLRAQRAVIEWNILENEPRSLARDRHSRTPNLLELLCARDGCSVPEGLAELRRRQERASQAYDEVTAALRRSSAAEPYLALLDACRDGGRRSAANIRGRYQSP